MSDCCLCYVVDENYLFPTLLSAIQATQNITPGLASVVIVCAGGIHKAREHVFAAAQQHGILLLEIEASRIHNLHPTWGRMFLHEILPPQFQRILYLDGDTQILGSLDPFFTYPLPPGRILATRDPAISFGRLNRRWERKIHAHCTRIGFALPCDRYFNAGLILFHRQEWPEVAELTFAAYRDHGATFIYEDQDALNLAIPDRALLISERWNFPGFLIGSEAERVARPRIYHFFSNPRPWLVAARPWGERGMKPYKDLLAAWPGLAAVAPAYSLGQRLRYFLQQAFKMITEYGRVGRITKELPVDVDLLLPASPVHPSGVHRGARTATIPPRFAVDSHTADPIRSHRYQ